MYIYLVLQLFKHIHGFKTVIRIFSLKTLDQLFSICTLAIIKKTEKL